jgi:hypothetical protein
MGLAQPARLVGEVCFNTAMTGYQEILTDPSYASQFITFTFPHIGNVGTNDDDQEQLPPGEDFIGARGLIVKADVTDPSNWRATQHWMLAEGTRHHRAERNRYPRPDRPYPPSMACPTRRWPMPATACSISTHSKRTARPGRVLLIRTWCRT